MRTLGSDAKGIAMKRLILVLALAGGTAPLLGQQPQQPQGPAALGAGVRRPPPPTGPSPRLPDGTIDLRGLWVGGGPSGERANLEVQGGLKSGDISPLPWVKDYLAKVDLQKDPYIWCMPMGVVRKSPLPWRFVAEPAVGKAAKILYLIEEGGTHSYRQIFVDGRKHPDDPSPTWMGDSIGWWEGDTLVVETVGFNGRTWMDRRALPLTERGKVTERYTRLNMGTLERVVTVDDPDAYARPFTARFTARLSNPEDDILEFICNENNQAGLGAGTEPPREFPVVAPPPGAATRP